ncbi:hypothetical protein J5N97_017207 [Dioscorea zingiberensis]|uniref:Uncharacterized protein n=1 Tax=Dioscorea zingiberensis TaxID=325984 RepID=A0A9D5HGC6_9LILI|nr:hypothetical protein J5N97_017207 [Dioscorea zingiberensis]
MEDGRRKGIRIKEPSDKTLSDRSQSAEHPITAHTKPTLRIEKPGTVPGEDALAVAEVTIRRSVLAAEMAPIVADVETPNDMDARMEAEEGSRDLSHNSKNPTADDIDDFMMGLWCGQRDH